MPETVRFDDAILVRCSTQMAAFVDRAAAQKGQKKAEWLRRAIATALALESGGSSSEAA